MNCGDCFWLTEDQFSRLAPLLSIPAASLGSTIGELSAASCTCGSPAAAGSTHRKSMARIRHSTTGSSGGREGRMGRHLRYFGIRWRPASASPDRQFGGEGTPLLIWRQRGEQNQAIGRSRGGRTTKIHALTDSACRPIAFMLSGGQVADCTAGRTVA